MTTVELERKIEELKSWEALLAEADATVESLKNELKAELEERKTEELEVGKYILRFTSVLSNRFDTTAFKKVYNDLYKSFTKQVASRRFSVS